MKRLIVVVVLSVLAAPCLAFGQATPQKTTPGKAGGAADPATGTWELNLAKSKYASSLPPKSETRTIEVVGDRMTYTARTIGADGKTTVSQFTAGFDGKEYPLKGSPNSDSISLKRIDQFTTESLTFKAGKVVVRNRRVVSSDGKVMTLTAQSTNAKGETLTNIQVYDKK